MIKKSQHVGEPSGFFHATCAAAALMIGGTMATTMGVAMADMAMRLKDKAVATKDTVGK